MANKENPVTAGPIPEIHCPFPSQVNPYLDEARTHLAAWVRDIGLVQRDSARRRFERADFGWFAAVVYPTADRRHLELMADWFAWLFLVDDQLDDGGVGRSLEQADAAVATLLSILEDPAQIEIGPAGHGLPTAVSSLADLWRRTAAGAPAQWRRRFSRHLEECLTTAAVWEAGNRVRGIVPDEQTYVEKRRHTGAIYVCMDLIDITEHLDVPEALYDAPEFTAALNAACNVVCWTNDIYSLEKERSLGEIHNLVYLVERHRGLEPEEAMAEVCAATSAETRRFLTAERELLQAYPGDAGLLEPYVAGMRSWIRGNLDWSASTKRYRPSVEATPAQPADYLESALLRSEP
jgi:hypothetical protein